MGSVPLISHRQKGQPWPSDSYKGNRRIWKFLKYLSTKNTVPKNEKSTKSLEPTPQTILYIHKGYTIPNSSLWLFSWEKAWFGSIPARMLDRMCTWGGHRARSSHLYHSQHIFYTVGMWSPSHSIIHIAPLIKKEKRDYSVCYKYLLNEWLQL